MYWLKVQGIFLTEKGQENTRRRVSIAMEQRMKKSAGTYQVSIVG
jgi:hypothetical protein